MLMFWYNKGEKNKIRLFYGKKEYIEWEDYEDWRKIIKDREYNDGGNRRDCDMNVNFYNWGGEIRKD